MSPTGVGQNEGRDPKLPQELVCLCTQGDSDGQREESGGTAEESVRRRIGDAAGTGNQRCVALLRPLRTDGEYLRMNGIVPPASR